jgi:hypothetical protein
MSNLKKEAEALGIEVDGRWSDDTLKEKIAEAKTAKVSKSAEAAKVAPVNTAEARDVPSMGGVRVETSQDIRQADAGENLPVPPHDGDAKKLHDVAVGLSAQPAATPEFDTTGIENKADQGEKEELYPIRLLVDWWDGQGIRRARNTEVDVPWNEAKKLVSEGKAERADAWTTKRS